MKKKISITIGTIAFAGILAFGFMIAPYSGNSINENIKVEDFNSVGIALDATIYLEQGEKHNVDIDAAPEILEKILVEVKDGELLVRSKNNKSDLKGPITVRITAPDYKSVSLSGSAKLLAENDMNLEDLILKIAGSGTMDFARLTAEELEIKISGSGMVNLAGKGAGEMEASIAGSGNLEATQFRVGEFDARISGSGDCKVFADNEINVSIAGSGSVYYKGEPQVSSTVAGSGKVKPLE